MDSRDPCVDPSHLGFGERAIATDIHGIPRAAIVDGGSETVVPRLSEARNPYLYPVSLLDRWTASSSASDSSALIPPGHHAKTDSIGTSFSEDGSSSAMYTNDRCGWWLAHVKPRQEKKLSTELRRLQVPHYLPTTECKALTRGRVRVTQQPQFAGYLFLWVNSDQRRTALETNRIVGTYPAGCDYELGRHLWDLADLIEKGVPLRTEERLAAGQTVRVKSGLLKDKRGTVIKRGGKTRLFIFVSEMLGGVSLEVDQHLLEPY